MTRTRDQDACPGALQVHQAADGALVRVRLPGGAISGRQLEALAHATAEFGNGNLELTSRGSLQLRAITDPDAVADAIAGAGLLPSATHERVRNIVASPLSGRAGGLIDVRPWVAELDSAIQADTALAGLPGRFWISLDDGRADVSGLRADLGVQAVGEDTVALLVSGIDTGVRLASGDAVATLLRVASAFQRIRGTRWRTAELDDMSVLLDGFSPSAPAGALADPVTRGPIGWIAQDRAAGALVALGAGVPLGVLPSRTAEFLAAIEAPIVITPWRSLLVCDLSEGVAETSVRVLAPMDLVFDENSPWLSVTACTGSPGCERSAADVRADAVAAVESGDVTGRVHYVGCERACGSPLDGEVMVATPDGYRLRKPS
ncbi:MAG TPA: precorrin-3B synthase [Mycobacterium sp.]|nr:precorrin-3B synthase [Mycobacterium sp.]